jgi:hypothetical protein
VELHRSVDAAHIPARSTESWFESLDEWDKKHRRNATNTIQRRARQFLTSTVGLASRSEANLDFLSICVYRSTPTSEMAAKISKMAARQLAQIHNANESI